MKGLQSMQLQEIRTRTCSAMRFIVYQRQGIISYMIMIKYTGKDAVASYSYTRA